MDVPQKANRILNYVLLAFVLIAIRVWFLAVVQHDMHVELAKRPQRRTLIEKAPRGTIRDRFNVPLAINRINFSVAVCYDEIRNIPRVKWENKHKTYPRKVYIERLSQLLARELNLNPTEIEDIIHSKASLFPNTPFILRKGVEENTFYKMKGMEKEWPGLVAQIGTQRHYPQGKLAAQLIGRLGKMDYTSYHQVAHEIETLQEYLTNREEGNPVFLPQGFASVAAVYERLHELKARTYQFDDQIGKSGIEKSFEAQLRGKPGKSAYLVNSKGHLLHRHPGSTPAVPGDRLLLSISAEMQELAEKLLSENEQFREKRFNHFSKKHHTLTPPWIKGGAIVAMVPKTGEIVAFASHPRCDPNDFIRNANISKWLETEAYVGSIWDGRSKLEREIFSFLKDGYDIEYKKLTWDTYLDYVLSVTGTTRTAINQIASVKEALAILDAFSALLDLSEQSSPHALMTALYSKDPLPPLESSALAALAQHEDCTKLLRETIDPFLRPILRIEDKILVLDLLKLCVGPKPPPSKLQENTLAEHRELTQCIAAIRAEAKKKGQLLYERTDFAEWREEHFSSYLKEKRKEEKERKTYQRPYIEYLNRAKRDLFSAFWEENGTSIIVNALIGDGQDKYTIFLSSLSDEVRSKFSALAKEEIFEALESMPSFDALAEPLYGTYPQLGRKAATTKHLAKAFYPQNGFGFRKSFAHGEATPFGSIYKVVVAYEAIRQHAEKGHSDLNPLNVIDEYNLRAKTPRGAILGYTEDGKPITRRYKGGRMPKSHARIGKVDLPTAMERSSNIYFSLLASDVIEKPQDLIDATERFGFGKKTGIPLPGEFPGLVPRDVCEDKSALYSMAIGQHSLLATPLQAADFLSTMANHGTRVKPQLLHLSVHADPLKKGENEKLLTPLKNVGVHFPFFLSTVKEEEESHVETVSREEIGSVPFEEAQRTYLFDTMKRVFTGTRGSARPNAVRYLFGKPKVMRSYLQIRNDLIGKTSTSEISYKPTLDREAKPILVTHIWFGALAFAPQQSPIKDPYSEPELAVVVYLQHGDYGKEGAPLVAQLVQKWRELQKPQELASR